MLILSEILLFITLLAVILNLSIRSKIKTSYIAAGGVFLSVLSAMVFVDFNSSNHFENTKILLSVMHSIQVMLAGFEFENMYGVLEIKSHYTYLAFLFTLAPICTFGFVLSFFKGLKAATKYALKYFCDIYILSDVSEKTVILAESVREKDKKALIVFKSAENAGEALCKKAESIGAVMQKSEISDTCLKFHGRKSKAVFFLMKEDESENLNDTLCLINRFKMREKCELYVSSASDEGGILIDSVKKENMKVRRINEIRQTAYLEVLGKEGGNPTFPFNLQSAEKEVSFLILGMGGHGTELLKALLWCGQLPGINLKITVIDKDENAESKFKAQCPEIIEKNGNSQKGEACYDLKIFGGVDVKSSEFADIVNSLGKVSGVYVSLGDDNLNIETAINARVLFRRLNFSPFVKAIVYSSEKCERLSGNLTNYKKQSYDIGVAGNIKSRYGFENVTGEKIEKMALMHHMSYASLYCNGDANALKEAEKDFNEYEYLRNSSAASAIYKTQYEKRNYTNEEIEEMSVYEHMRWNAYMRTEGFVYGRERCDIAKVHNDLTDYDKLSKEEKNKDTEMVNIVDTDNE